MQVIFSCLPKDTGRSEGDREGDAGQFEEYLLLKYLLNCIPEVGTTLEGADMR